MCDAPRDDDLLSHFRDLPDPRVTGRCDYPLLDLVAIAVCAVLCGADEWTEVAEWGDRNEEWLRTWCDLPTEGMPSHDTFGRVFAMLDPREFENRFARWAASAAGKIGGKVVAVDGKALRRSGDRKNGKAAIHVVSAWANAEGLLLGQIKADEKSNEITAIPELLRTLDLAGCIVTIDAAGCQKKIAEEIVAAGADYVLALKGNQAGLAAEVAAVFEETAGEAFDDCREDTFRTEERGHGRHEVREVRMIEDFVEGKRRVEWRGLRCIGEVRSTRTVDGKTSVETRHYITSLPCDAEQFAGAVREHWGVENRLHWSLDVTFGEDASRVRTGNAPENFALLRRLALSALKSVQVPHRKRAENSARRWRPQPTTPYRKMSLKLKRQRCDWNHEFLLDALQQI